MKWAHKKEINEKLIEFEDNKNLLYYLRELEGCGLMSKEDIVAMIYDAGIRLYYSINCFKNLFVITAYDYLPENKRQYGFFSVSNKSLQISYLGPYNYKLCLELNIEIENPYIRQEIIREIENKRISLDLYYNYTIHIFQG